MDYRKDINTYNDDGTVNVVVEIPLGSHNKYEIDEVTGDRLTIVRTLNDKFPHNYKYIYNYGFIPNTYAPDKDQLDAIIISDERIEPLTIVKCRVLGVVKTIDDGEEDDKILALPVYSTQKTFNLSKIIKFLKNYKYPRQAGTTIGDVLDADEAHKIISACRIYMK